MSAAPLANKWQFDNHADMRTILPTWSCADAHTPITIESENEVQIQYYYGRE